MHERAQIAAIGATLEGSAQASDWSTARVLLARYPMAAALLAAQLVLLAVVAPEYGRHGLAIDWSSVAPSAIGQAGLVLVWLYFRRYERHPTKNVMPDVVLAMALLILLTNILSPAQYVAVAFRRPLIDPILARADALVGIHVPTLARWTAGHPVAALLLALCYVSFLAQVVLVVLLVGLRARDRERLWEFAFHFHFCLIATIALFAVFPAACAFQYYGFRSTLDWTRFIAQFNGVRDGTFHVIQFNNLEGLVSMPSFHVAVGLMIPWALRGRGWLFAVAALLDAGMIASTVMTGSHYFIDVVASGALFGVSLIAYRALPVRFAQPPAAAFKVDLPTSGSIG